MHALSDTVRSAITDPRVIRTRQALRDALLTLLKRMSFDAISIRDLTGVANVAYASFFRNYADKSELLHDLAAEEIAHFLKLVLPVHSMFDSSAACLTICQYVDKHRVLWSTLLTGGAAGILREELLREAAKIPVVRSDGKMVGDWMPDELRTNHGTGATIELLAWWLKQPQGKYSVEQIADALNRLVVAPAVNA